MHLLTRTFDDGQGPKELSQCCWPSPHLGELRLMCTEVVSLPRVANRCTYSTRSKPTSSGSPPRITTPHRMLSRKAIKDLDCKVSLTETPRRRLGRQVTLRRDKKLWELSFPYSAPQRHPPAPINPNLHLIPRTNPPLRLKISTNLPTSSRTLSHSSIRKHHWVGIHTQYQPSKSLLLIHPILSDLPLRRLRLRVVAVSPGVARRQSTRIIRLGSVRVESSSQTLHQTPGRKSCRPMSHLVS